MPNKPAAKKHLRQTSKRTQRNFLVKRKIHTIIKRGHKAIAAGQTDKVAEISKTLQQAVDKAVKSDIIKANTGDRLKSRFMAKVKLAKK